MKHIILFSGGVQSAFTVHILLQKLSKQDIILLYTDTKTEHCDNYRFRNDLSKFFDIPITTVQDGRDVWQLIDDLHDIPTARFRLCTDRLKIRPRKRFCKQFSKDDFTLYFGFDKTEWRRMQRMFARCQQERIKVDFPLKDITITKEEIKKIITEKWGIPLPQMYKLFKHANCLPCFLWGKKDWYLCFKFFPEIYDKVAKLEQTYGTSAMRETYLSDLKTIFQSKEFKTPETSALESFPCECVY